MKVESIALDRLPEGFYNLQNVIYGAGLNGRLLLDKLKVANCEVSYFYDDDEIRWGEDYNNIKILSRRELIDLYEKGNCNIIISSMYVGQIINKLSNIGVKKAYVALQELLDKDNNLLEFKKYDNVEYHKKLDTLIDYFVDRDENSADYFKLIKYNVCCGEASRKLLIYALKKSNIFQKR